MLQRHALACVAGAKHGQYVLGEFDADGDNGIHGLPRPISESVDEQFDFPSKHAVAGTRKACSKLLARDGEVLFFHWAAQSGGIA